ncbi:proline--tRNA ligase, partial [Mammaliicoccus vitulinus]
DHTHEFMALAEIGEDTIVYSETSDFAANIEKAEVAYTPNHDHTPVKELEKVETPNIKTAQALADFLNVSLDKIIKSMIVKVEDEYVMILIRGHHEVNDVKLKSYFKTENIEMASENEIENILGAKPGSLGPVNVNQIKIYADNFVQDINNLAVGANENDFHYLNANVDRDFNIEAYGDFRFILEGEELPNDLGKAKFAEGIEVGQVFKLGTKYSESMDATFLDEQGKAKPLIMGCYGVGISRTLSAVIEQHHDEKGIIWPKSIAPYEVHLIAINPKKDEQKELAEQLYGQLKNQYDVLYDDRKESAGVKFNDADLIGLPVRVMVGKKAGEGIVEVKRRDNSESQEVHIDELNDVLASFYNAVK